MKKNIAVIGYGGMGGWHAEHLLKSDVAGLAGVYDTDKNRLDLALSQGIKIYKTLQELLADNKIDVVTIATPNDAHEEITVKSLEAGKHVICEKPVTLSIDSLNRMIASSEKNNKLFTVHQNRRWDIDYLAMKKLSDSGEIGEIINLESRIHGSRGIPSDWRGTREQGGGMLYDWGIHIIDQALMILGWDVKSVRCSFENITNDEVDDGFRMELCFNSGTRAYIEVGTYNFIAMPRFYMRGKNGTAMIMDWREKCKVVKCKHWHENDVAPVKTAAGLTKTMAPRNSVTVDEYEIDKPASDVHDFYRNFTAAIDGRETPLVTHKQMKYLLKIIMDGFKSNETGETIVW